jgi:hypothetical protein
MVMGLALTPVSVIELVKIVRARHSAGQAKSA